jgi:hypothetical protein
VCFHCLGESKAEVQCRYTGGRELDTVVVGGDMWNIVRTRDGFEDFHTVPPDGGDVAVSFCAEGLVTGN